MNHGPEKTPHSDPDRPHGENAGPGESGPLEPAPPTSVDSEVTEDPDERGPGAEAPSDPVVKAPADGDADTETGADARTETADDDTRTDTAAPAPGAGKAPGDGPDEP
ncbi:hypothetical protein D3105_30660, partial [Streptomyces globisporus]